MEIEQDNPQATKGNNMESEYYLGNQKLTVENEEADLGVIISNTLKSKAQCVKAVQLANAKLAMIKRTFICKSNKIILPPYKSGVLHSGLVSSFMQRLILLEKVQWKATKMNYYDRLRVLNPTMLEVQFKVTLLKLLRYARRSAS